MNSNSLKFLFCNNRFSPSSIQRSSIVDDFYSDRSRIIFSSSFRRLQQKAQVFSLEPNASVRTRMTHTLEVADIGRTLASKISSALCKRKLLTAEEMPLFVAIVENACLLHDIGNPPFGHFGESAIREWAKNLDEIAGAHKLDTASEAYKLLMSDFHEFDGNPQGVRIMMRLHSERDRHSLNLSYSTILTAIKYARSSGESKEDGIYKKAGYFQSEKNLVDSICMAVGRNRRTRFPLTYIMEAADDIAYRLSDISDGIEKNIITLEDFHERFLRKWEKTFKKKRLPIKIGRDISNFSLGFSVPVSQGIIKECVVNFDKNCDIFLEGKIQQLIPKNGASGILDIVKKISDEILYSSIKAESIELSGYAIISGILETYQKLLTLDVKEFNRLIKNKFDGLDYERRIFNRIGKRYIKAYKYMLDDFSDLDPKLKEWWARVHLIVDHVSGMTDEFALDTYQMFKGIKLLPV